MSRDQHFNCALHPVTALIFLTLDRVYLLAGEGQYLRAFDFKTSTPLLRSCIFKSEIIHGIACSHKEDAGQLKSAKLLVWGGRSLCLVELSIQGHAKDATLCLRIACPEFRSDDWILHASSRPSIAKPITSYTAACEAVLVTAHNELSGLIINDGMHYTTRILGSGPKSLLYSAHISWSSKDYDRSQILVAAGTVFGEVLLWSVQYDQNWDSIDSQPCHSFKGHQGSVFGVQISNKMNMFDGSIINLLASCSDDRTILIWDISNIDKADRVDASAQCLASTMAHASRIWSVQFLNGQAGSLGLLSFGEDGTSQAWLLKPPSGAGPAEGMSVGKPLELVHRATYHYHSGKHIWAASILEERDNNNTIATGGADGRIVSYVTSLQNFTTAARTASCQANIDRLGKIPKTTERLIGAKTRRKAVFDSLEGHWQLSRILKSSLSTFPSGTLTGRANIKKRPITNAEFNDECLYTEEGDFVTENNLRMKARRQYVYRYQRNVDKLSVWFVRTDDRAMVDYLFHFLDFTNDERDLNESKTENDETILIARGHHACVKDSYIAEYEFTLASQKLKAWTVKYTVKGPQKDYVAYAKYARLSPDEERPQVHIPLRNSSENNSELTSRRPSVDSFKNYVWITDTEFLTTTEQGDVLIGKMEEDSSTTESETNASIIFWTLVGYTNDLKLSSLLTSIPSRGIAFLIGSNGNVFRYQRYSNVLEFAVVCQQKPAFLRAQEVVVDAASEVENKSLTWRKLFGSADLSRSHPLIGLVSTGLISDEVIISLHSFDVHQGSGESCKMSFQLPKGFVVTSSCLIDKPLLIILGSRNGALCMYDPSTKYCNTGTSSLEYVCSDVHGQEAITDIRVVPDRKPLVKPGTIWILTTGRDGSFAVHLIQFSEEGRGLCKLELKTYHKSTLPFGPNIEGSHFETSNGDLLLWGFRSKEFLVWNESKKAEIMSIECGGAHRYWAFSPLDDGQGVGNFVWTKASICNVHNQTKSSHKILQDGGHGREIKAVAVKPDRERSDGHGVQLVATGAEDTAIRIFEYDAEAGYKCLRIITKHTTGIQKLQWSGTRGQYLFSAAGCEEFFIWETVSIPTLGIGVACRLSCSPVTPDKDLRIMDFCVLDTCVADEAAKSSSVQLIAMVYSDSSVRIFEFCNAPLRGYNLNLLLEGSYTTHCLTKVAFIQFGREIFLCTASTDGYLAFWSMEKVLLNHGFHASKGASIFYNPDLRSNCPTKMLSWQKRIPVHQNCIKSLIHVEISPTEHLIVTGGDDQAFALSKIFVQSIVSADHDESRLKHTTLLVSNAHASAVTAVAFLSKKAIDTRTTRRFATVGNDQRLKIWEILDDTQAQGVDGFRIRKQSDVHTSIADASALETFTVPDDKPDKICVAGIGMETWLFDGRLLVPEQE